MSYQNYDYSQQQPGSAGSAQGNQQAGHDIPAGDSPVPYNSNGHSPNGQSPMPVDSKTTLW